jgi:3-hydroxyacyl-CoA dehydrogenase
MNRDHQIADAKQRVLDLAPGYLPPLPKNRCARWVAKDWAISNTRSGPRRKQDRRRRDVRVGRAIAYVLCGGDGTARDVTEQDILDFEREQFLSLLGTKETQERIAYTLKTGKPLRN